MRITRNIPLRRAPNLAYDLYEPQDAAGPLQSIHFVYGGSWRTGLRGCYAFVGAALARRGFRVLIPDYRLFPEAAFPDFVYDVAAGFAEATELNDHPTRAAALVAHSAGAHMAALVCTDPRYLQAFGSGLPRPSAFVGMSGPYVFDPTTWNTTAEIFTAAADEPDRARPIALANPTFPRTLLVHGARDTLVTPNATELFAARLRELQVPVEKTIVAWAAHAGPILAFARPASMVSSILSDTVMFLKRSPPTLDPSPVLDGALRA
ncbi:MAG: alpha/beta hydrolase [Hyphomicrobiaceae bacterium]